MKKDSRSATLRESFLPAQGRIAPITGVKMNIKPLFQPLKYLAVTGNILFILWLLYNGIDEGFRASAYQLMSYIGLTLLLLLNSVLLFTK
jgi:hypothetical protein